MLPEISYEMPPHKLFPPRHPKITEAERELTRALSDPRERLALSFHEGAHAVQYRKLGIEFAFGGPSVVHDCPTDTYSVSFGTTQVRDRDYLKLASEHPEKLAKVLVAGRVAELVLMGENDPRTSENDLSDFLYFAKGQKSELIGIWKTAEENYFRELSEDLNEQREIIREAARYTEKIFGPDASVRNPKRPSQAKPPSRSPPNHLLVISAPHRVRLVAPHSIRRKSKMSAEISKKLHRPGLPTMQGQKTQDTETDREHIKGPAKSTEPAKS